MNKKIHIPTREEFHREYAGEIRLDDFCTEQSRRRTFPYQTNVERRKHSQSKKMR